MTELWQLSALQLAEVIRTRHATSRDVLQAHYDRIEKVNGALNAVVDQMADEAFAAADVADRAVPEGAGLGPLHGVPLSVKENIDVAGWATTQGVPALAEAVAPVDAPIVERMRAAGAIPFVRTNLPDFGLRVHTDSTLRGLTRNPWHREVTAGGSSGGEAAALASGMSPIGLGNDIGGSLRNPAHCCGIASIKPSTGVVPFASAIPPEDPGIMFQLMAVQGVMARRVADVHAGFLAAAGPHDRDPTSLPVTLPPAHDRPLRVAVLTDPPGGPTDPGISGAIRGAADALTAAGHHVADAAPPGFEQAIDLWGALLIMDIAAMRPELDRVMGEGGRQFLDLAGHRLVPTDAAGWSGLFAARHRLARGWTSFFGEWDVLLSPTWAMPAFRHGADIVSAEGAVSTLELISPVVPANLLGLPAAVAPAGVVDGLPVGAMFTAARFADLTALAAAQALEDAVGVLTPIDPR